MENFNGGHGAALNLEPSNISNMSIMSQISKASFISNVTQAGANWKRRMTEIFFGSEEIKPEMSFDSVTSN